METGKHLFDNLENMTKDLGKEEEEAKQTGVVAEEKLTLKEENKESSTDQSPLKLGNYSQPKPFKIAKNKSPTRGNETTMLSRIQGSPPGKHSLEVTVNTTNL